jgi:transcriptional regulator with GAF, ATPase, and Fis domain
MTIEHGFIGDSAAMAEMIRAIGVAARTDASVLILGESGTGKELVAQTIHSNSGRRERRLVALNCVGLDKNLLASELFGHEKGAFTGADRRRIGKFELPDGGTLFLDEIGDMALALQPELLRALEQGEIDRLGSPFRSTSGSSRRRIGIWKRLWRPMNFGGICITGSTWSPSVLLP